MRTYLNLLPAAVKRQQLISQRIRQWSVALVIGLILLSLHAWGQWTHHCRRQARLEALQAEAQPVLAMQQESDQLRGEIDQLKQREAIVLQLADERPVLPLLGIVSHAASRCSGGVRVLKFQLEKSAEPANAERRRVLLLEGIGSDHLAVAQFASALRESQAFVDVQLKSSASQGSQVTEERNYTVECAF